ncbi:MAG: hypothetical protein JXR73_13485 [Candidatus Omnitrophica bacterium]|nr:hypothetical protein [Candidatus Omnitrophota bacterium]
MRPDVEISSISRDNRHKLYVERFERERQSPQGALPAGYEMTPQSSELYDYTDA